MIAFIAPEGNLIKVALVNQGVHVLFDADILGRAGTIDSIFAAKVLRKEGDCYWCDLGLPRPGLLTHEKNPPLLQEGEKVLVQISREAFTDGGEHAIHGQKKPVELTQQIVLAHQSCLYFPRQQRFKQRGASPVLPLTQQQKCLVALFQKINNQFIVSKAPLVLHSGPTVIERFLKGNPP